jgi:hypothetical protein
MSSMKRLGTVSIFLLACVIGAISAPHIVAQTGVQTGSIEFVARATPSSGIEEPVRGFPFYLLSKSFREISKEAEATYPKPDMDAFIDTLDSRGYSKPLKSWMKKNHRVRLSGEDFVNKLDVSDIMDVPEFFAAYTERMTGDQTVTFPTAKYKPAEKAKDPAKYDRLVAEYHDAVRRFLIANPKSTDGMDLNLEDVDPSNKWDQIVAKNQPEFHRSLLELAQTRYLVARAETDLQGQGFLRGIPPGNYWLTTLEVAASIGDAHLRWDVPITVRAGSAATVALTNINATHPSGISP